MDVRADEVFVGNIHPGGLDLAGDHELRVFEEILVMGAAEGAIGKDHRRLAASSGSSASLGVIGRGWGNVAHVDGIQVFDVDAEFHGGRAEKNGQPGIAEFPLPFDAELGEYLGGMFPGIYSPEFVDPCS